MTYGKKTDKSYCSFFKGCAYYSVFPYQPYIQTRKKTNYSMLDPVKDFTVAFTFIPILPIATVLTFSVAFLAAVMGVLSYPFVRLGACVKDAITPEPTMAL